MACNALFMASALELAANLPALVAFFYRLSTFQRRYQGSPASCASREPSSTSDSYWHLPPKSDTFTQPRSPKLQLQLREFCASFQHCGLLKPAGFAAGGPDLNGTLLRQQPVAALRQQVAGTDQPGAWADLIAVIALRHGRHL